VPQHTNKNAIVKPIPAQTADKSPTDAIEKIEPEQSSGSYSLAELSKSSDVEIAQQVIDRISPITQRLGEMLPLINELRRRFAALPRGKANIMGCKTWTEFCRKKLNYTDRAVRKALAIQRSPIRPGSKGVGKADKSKVEPANRPGTNAAELNFPTQHAAYRSGFEAGWHWREKTLKPDNPNLKTITPKLKPDSKSKSAGTEKLSTPPATEPNRHGKSILQEPPQPTEAQLACRHDGGRTPLSGGRGYLCELCKWVVTASEVTQTGDESHEA
jgi:hypothetical protein